MAVNPRKENLFFSKVFRACILFLWLAGFWLSPPVFSGQNQNLEEEERKIAADLRCVVCQNLSVADSPSEMAQQMRAIIREQLEQGKTPEEIKAYFVSKYGDWVLLAPPAQGFGLLIWILPFAALGCGLLVAAYFVHQWAGKRKRPAGGGATPELIQRLRAEVSAERPARGESSDERFRKALLEEQARLRSDIQELELDYQAGKLSAADYDELRRDSELQEKTIEQELASLSSKTGSAAPVPSDPVLSSPGEKEPAGKPKIPAWQVAAGALFLLFLGIAVGVFLTKSLKPRTFEQDSITGDFLTGTGTRDLSSLLGEGRSAFERREWGAAIDAFKKILEIDANQPEAHAYMGLILAQAGHADESVAAFDRALAVDPDFPVALWGKGMLLRAKGDYAGARELLDRLARLMPAGDEKEQVQKILLEVTTLAASGKKVPREPKIPTIGKNIRGTISLGPKLKSKDAASAVLFIIARPADSSGPPLAVKKIERPAFPVRYTLGPEDSMIPGRSLAGRVFLSARLDQDGNPTTRGAGDWVGDYGKNPVEVGAEGVNITIDRPGGP